ncbi:centrosomal protein of 89 kDa-like isoform X1 [Uloborus diversus]|uniref:centrosomal protein of 89 kDa-like isoform X1 n=1 Tax=Uloborus diversus TaxID=327109 RepID=UPI00240908C7|nr:centrosomal protein of 89 kDa-like isoform X1 [Uloborus diversus]
MALKLSMLDKKSSISSKQKCKNLLISVLSPTTKKSERTKKLHQASSFQEVGSSSIEEKCDKTSNNPSSLDNYASIQELHLHKTADTKSSTETLPSHFGGDVEVLPVAGQSSSDPIYATVKKKHEEDLGPVISAKILADQCKKEQRFNQANEDLAPQDNLKEKVKEKSQQEALKNEKIKILQERLKESAEENKKLRSLIENLVKEEKGKEDTLHAKFQLKLTEFEAETRKDIKCLTERIQILVNEREILSEQVQILHQDKKALQLKCDSAYKKMKLLISPEFHEKAIAEQKKLLSDSRTKHSHEKQQLQETYNILEEKYNSSMIKIQEFQESKRLLEQRISQLKASEHECQKERARIQSQLEESKQMEKDAQILVQSLLKVAENVVNERDILLNKASYQDHQQKMMQTTIVNYSLNLGRLEEHVTHLSRNKSEELIKSKEIPLHIESIKQSYVQEIDFLRSKVLNQSNIIHELEGDKRKLESQLLSIQEAVYIGKPKLFDDVNSLNFLNM